MTDHKPVIVAVVDDPDALAMVRDHLERRYAADYDVICDTSCKRALELLRGLRWDAAPVALVLADLWTSGLTGADLLGRVRELHPHARRALLIEWGGWGDPKTAGEIKRCMARGEIDYYIPKPWRMPDEHFHRMVTEFLLEWSRTRSNLPREIAVVGERWQPRVHELRSLLARNGMAHEFHPSTSEEGSRLLEGAGHADERAPVVVLLDGRALVDPSNAELAEAYGVDTRLVDPEHVFDVIVVGAGPGGLAASVYAASEGLDALTIERESIGGQAGASSLIRNYLGFSRGVSGAELAQRAYQQAWVFGSRFLLMSEVVSLRTEPDHHVLVTASGVEARARTVVLATGAAYRRLHVPELEELVGSGVYYGASGPEATAVTGEPVFVLGGGNSAGQAAVYLSRYAERVSLLVRGESLAASMSKYLRRQIDATENVELRFNTEVIGGSGHQQLESITVRDRSTGATETLAAAGLFVMIGAEPHTDWLPPTIGRDEWGYVPTGSDIESGWPLERAPRTFETSLPGVFAVGDVNHASIARVASAVGDGSAVIRQVHVALAALDHQAPPPSVATPPAG